MTKTTYTAHVFNGLDHYTATVTEATTLLGAKRAVSSPRRTTMKTTRIDAPSLRPILAPAIVAHVRGLLGLEP
jgi:hypothetical protein